MIEQENKLKQQESVQDDKNALVQFLLDIDCLSPLSKYINGVNVFDVLSQEGQNKPNEKNKNNQVKIYQ